jgi:hypothetical protein
MEKTTTNIIYIRLIINLIKYNINITVITFQDLQTCIHRRTSRVWRQLNIILYGTSKCNDIADSTDIIHVTFYQSFAARFLKYNWNFETINSNTCAFYLVDSDVAWIESLNKKFLGTGSDIQELNFSRLLPASLLSRHVRSSWNQQTTKECDFKGFSSCYHFQVLLK